MAKKKPAKRMWWDGALEALTTLGIEVYKAWKDPDSARVRPRSDQPTSKNPRQRVKPPTSRKPGPAKWWKVLGVTSTAAPKEIRAAYRARMRESHPDKVAHLSPALRKAAEREAKRIDDAYERAREQ